MNDWIDLLLENTFWSAVVIFLTQLLFIYLRTINVIYTSERKMWPSVFSGLGIGVSWLVSMSIGINSFLKGDFIPISLFLLGGAIGTYWGINQDKKNKIKKNKITGEEIFNISKEFEELKNELKSFKNNYKNSLEPIKISCEENKEKINFLKNKIGFRKISKKLDGWKSEHDFIELYAMIYILDNGTRKNNPPYVHTDSNGNTDAYNKDFGPNSKMRLMTLKKLVLPGYFNEKDFWENYNNPDKMNFETIFGKSYKEITDLMYEHNYHRISGEMYTIDFY